MARIKVFTDSTSDLNKEDVERLGIEVIPLLVIFGNESFRDGVDITAKELYSRVARNGSLPKTAAINSEIFKERFKVWLDKGYQILYTGISSKLSTTYNCACIAAEELGKENIKVVDSMNLSTGIGLLVLKAARFAEEGYSLEEIEEKLNDIVPRVKTLFAIDTLEYLHKGGRCSSLAHFFGKIFNIHPIIKVTDGSMGVYKKPRGKIVNAWNEIIDDMKKDLEAGNIDMDHIMITHSDSPEGEKYIFGELSKVIEPRLLMVTKAGCVISSHCGYNTIGILYIANK